MAIVLVVTLMILVIVLSKRWKELGKVEFGILGLIVLLEVAVLLVQIYTMERPPAVIGW